MKIYWLIIALITYLGLSFGWILPWTISYPDTMVVWGGYIYAVTMPIVLYYFGKAIWKAVKKKLNPEN